MRIEYVLWLHGPRNRPKRCAEKVKASFCCENMRAAWEPEGGLGFSEDRQVAVIWNASWDYEGYYAGTSEEVASGPVRFCPFCGEPVEVAQAGLRDTRFETCRQRLRQSRRTPEEA